jgi:prepilin-type processing-associated H-X9-DG protein
MKLIALSWPAKTGEETLIGKPASAPRGGVSTAAPYPNGGVNLGLADGHVEHCRFDGLWSKFCWNAVATLGKRPGLPSFVTKHFVLRGTASG